MSGNKKGDAISSEEFPIYVASKYNYFDVSLHIHLDLYIINYAPEIDFLFIAFDCSVSICSVVREAHGCLYPSLRKEMRMNRSEIGSDSVHFYHKRCA